MTSYITTTEEAQHQKSKFASLSGDLKNFMSNADDKNTRMLMKQATYDDDGGIVSVCLGSESSTDNGDEIHIDQDFVLGCSSPKKEKTVDNIGRDFSYHSDNENSTDYDSSKLEKPGVAQENFNDNLHALEETCYDQTNTKLDSRQLSIEKASEIVEDSICSDLVEEDEYDDDLISDEKWHDLMKIEEEQEESYDLTEQGNDQITNSSETFKSNDSLSLAPYDCS
ncbi:unnamed protein product [Mytilus coruscus]|uniref:Uncharacterized protein n=1 Tax=Mytilus coruscus TaxID=42192 RepID=A0A6J8CK20_MYTCO|nr:unnamed protein product [Mytilus coruscus]